MFESGGWIRPFQVDGAYFPCFSYEYFDFLPLSREIQVNQISDSKLATHVM